MPRDVLRGTMLGWTSDAEAGGSSASGPLLSFLEQTPRWLEAHAMPVSIQRPKGVSAWLVPLPEGPSMQVFREPVQQGAPSCDQCRIMSECADRSGPGVEVVSL